MRTARLLPVSPSMHCSWGVYLVLGMYLVWGGVPGPGGSVPGHRGVYLVQGVPGYRGRCTWSRGCTWSWGDVPGPRGRGTWSRGCTWYWGVCTWSWGVYLVSGGVPGPGGGTYPGTPPPCEQNSWHTLLKILPCPKLRLWMVIMIYPVSRTKFHCYHPQTRFGAR